MSESQVEHAMNVAHDRSRKQTAFMFATSVLRAPESGDAAAIKRHERMHVMMLHRGVLPSDCNLLRMWYILMTAAAAYCYIVFTREIIWGSARGLPELYIRLVVCVLFFFDWLLHRKWVSASYPMLQLDLLFATPGPILLMIFHDEHGWWQLPEWVYIVVAALPVFKILRVKNMFQMSLPDAIDTSYVAFYYRWLPSMLFMFWFMVMMHTLVTVRLLCAVYPESYHDAITWVWIVMTSAP
eukprot:PhM_4_TR8364/c1_g1_i1/m.14602